MDKVKRVKAYAIIIEKTLEAFGFQTKVAQVYEFKDYLKFCLEIAMGTNLDDLLKHDKDLALALASPTGKVEIQAPIPGSSLVGINVPKNKGKDPVKKEAALYKYPFELTPKTEVNQKGWKQKLSYVFFILAYLFGKIGDKIVESQKKG